MFTISARTTALELQLMRENALRRVLLIKAIEETDRAGTLIPPADRAAATRETLRREGDTSVSPGAGPLDPSALRRLVTRANFLQRQVVTRYPFVDAVLNQRGVAWAGWLMILASVVIGFSLSTLNGGRRIDILAFPLIGLILWNLIVYIAVAVNAGRSLSRRAPPGPSIPGLLASTALSRIKRLIVKSAAFNAVLAEALGRFLGEWSQATRPMWVARAARFMHLCAAAVGLGLVAGLYLRGAVLDYHAGWESTFLNAGQVHAILSFIYAPASIFTGIVIPDEMHIAGIQIVNGVGGEGAARWMHLLAATAIIFVVLPRAILALLLTATISHRALHSAAPPSLLPYYRSVFGTTEGEHGVIAVMPYAYEPFGGATAALRKLLSSAFGDSLIITLHASARYGEEEQFMQQLAEHGDESGVIALLFNLAATPEEENHGLVIAGVRDWLQRSRSPTRLLILVDERLFASRMTLSSDNRLSERREIWRAFIAAHGLTACFVNLGQPDTLQRDLDDGHRLRDAVWQPAAT